MRYSTLQGHDTARWAQQARAGDAGRARGAQAGAAGSRARAEPAGGRARGARAGTVRGAQHKRATDAGARGWAHGALGARPAGWHGRTACAHRLGQLGGRAPDLVFNLVFRLGIFPESLNEHWSL